MHLDAKQKMLNVNMNNNEIKF